MQVLSDEVNLLKNMDQVKIIIFTPLSHADVVREALGKAGAGKIGNYSFCSFSTRGFGRFLPNANANPSIGEPGKFETVEEERIEVICDRETAKDVISAARTVHPYEEMTYEVYALLSEDELV